MRLDIESAFADASSSIQTFTGARALHDVALEPWSLTLAILPPRAGGKP
jgi:inactivated superfamily I helicase